MITSKAALRDEGERHADDRDAFAAQEERCSSWRRAKRGGVVACGVQGPLVDGGGELPGAGSPVMDTPVYRGPLQLGQFMMTLLYRVTVVSWLSVLVVAIPVLRLSEWHPWTCVLGVVLCLGFRVGCRGG